jgi:hypothetical protein
MTRPAALVFSNADRRFFLSAARRAVGPLGRATLFAVKVPDIATFQLLELLNVLRGRSRNPTLLAVVSIFVQR